MGYRKAVEKLANVAPKRIIFYRDGVSEGQFRQVIEIELPRIKGALFSCVQNKIRAKAFLFP
jgi:eukaryotic translation initiation factor 2C